MLRSLLAATAVVAVALHANAAELLKAGDALPAWQLRDQTGAAVSSTDLKGKTYLLWFYPMAMTPGCTAEGNALRDNFSTFQAKGVEIMGVSFDSPADNAVFVREQHFPFRLLSDSDRTFAVAVGAAQSADQATARRVSYLVGPDGKVMKAYGAVNPASHAQEVLADLPTPAARQ